MSALHRSDAFYAYTSSEGIDPQRSTTFSTPISAPIGWSLRYALNATADRMAFMDSAERGAFERDTSSENPNCSQ